MGKIENKTIKKFGIQFLMVTYVRVDFQQHHVLQRQQRETQECKISFLKRKSDFNQISHDEEPKLTIQNESRFD